MHEIRVIATEIDVQTWGSNEMHIVSGGNYSNILFFLLGTNNNTRMCPFLLICNEKNTRIALEE